MPTTVKVYIPDTLVIRACNTPGGSGGVWKWIEAVKKDTLRNAVRIAPKGKMGNYGSAYHKQQGSFPGRYRASFRVDGRGSNGHYLRRTITNIAPYAGIIEKGRPRTSRKWEEFTWTEYPGQIINLQGTSARPGLHTLERAFLMAMAKKRRTFVSGTIT